MNNDKLLIFIVYVLGKYELIAMSKVNDVMSYELMAMPKVNDGCSVLVNCFSFEKY